MQTSPAIIVFCHLRWDFVYQRPQHLLSRLASRHRVIFIEEPVPGDRLEWQLSRPDSNVLVCRPHTPSSAPGFHDEQMPHLSKLVRDLLDSEGINEYVVWFYT